MIAPPNSRTAGAVAASVDRAAGFSAYRLPVLMWVAAQRAVTLHQVLFRFWVLDGRAASHGFRVVRALVRDGLLESHPLRPELGRASLHVLTPSRNGWRELGQPPRKWPVHRLEDVLQFAHVCLLREADGWTIEPPGRVWPLLRRRALDILRGSPRRAEMAQEVRRRIEVMCPKPVGLWALHHRATGHVRLILNVRSFGAALRACERVLELRLLTEAAPIDIELTGANQDQLEQVRERLARGFDPRVSRKARRGLLRRPLPPLPLAFHLAPDFRLLPHASFASVPTSSEYADHGAASPLTMRTATPWMATRSGGVV